MQECYTELSGPPPATNPLDIQAVTRTVTTGWTSLFLSIKPVGTGQGHQFSHRMKHMEERNTHRFHQWWCRHRIRGTKSHGGWGHLDTNTCANPSHQPVLQGYGAFLWVCLFYPFTNILFSFPRQTRRIHPARTGILQIKTWIRPNTTCVCLERR